MSDVETVVAGADPAGLTGGAEPADRGRLSVILESPEPFPGRAEDEIAETVVADAARAAVGSHHDFPSPDPGHLADRPAQRVPVPGLTLAGDRARRRFRPV